MALFEMSRFARFLCPRRIKSRQQMKLIIGMSLKVTPKAKCCSIIKLNTRL